MAQFQLKKLLHYDYPLLLPITAVPFQVNLNSTGEAKKKKKILRREIFTEPLNRVQSYILKL